MNKDIFELIPEKFFAMIRNADCLLAGEERQEFRDETLKATRKWLEHMLKKINYDYHDKTEYFFELFDAIPITNKYDEETNIWSWTREAEVISQQMEKYIIINPAFKYINKDKCTCTPLDTSLGRRLHVKCKIIINRNQ